MEYRMKQKRKEKIYTCIVASKLQSMRWHSQLEVSK